MDEQTTEDLSESHELIKDCTPEQWDTFQERIEMVKLEDLAAIADRMGCDKQETWQDYVKVFSDYEWYQFIDAYYRVTYKRY